MSSAEVVTIVVSLSAFMLGTVLALVWYLGGRIDHLDDRLTGRIDRLDERLTSAVNRLAEDVAVLKVTRRAARPSANARSGPFSPSSWPSCGAPPCAS